MGAISILQFFSKLSQGTAQMSTSRQALRLGQRLSLGRLLGFYCAPPPAVCSVLRLYACVCAGAMRAAEAAGAPCASHTLPTCPPSPPIVLQTPTSGTTLANSTTATLAT
eukprot:scaffold3837_cov110-Isochrysis_galbana.AAC.3